MGDKSNKQDIELLDYLKKNAQNVKNSPGALQFRVSK
jgi:quinol monooxygenase YgiN